MCISDFSISYSPQQQYDTTTATQKYFIEEVNTYVVENIVMYNILCYVVFATYLKGKKEGMRNNLGTKIKPTIKTHTHVTQS